jgi:hypothetical protein
MYAVFRQKFGFQQDFRYQLVPVITPALAYVVHITPFKNALNHKAGFAIVIKLVEVHIPKDAPIENRFIFLTHLAKLTKYRI